MTAIKENGTTSLATYAYNNLGQRTSITRGNGVTTSYSYDSAQRLSSMAHDLLSTGSDQTISYTYSAANQQLTRSGTNASYVYTPPTNYVYSPANSLNQLTSTNGTSMNYDTRGNLTSDGTTSYSYDIYNRLIGAGGATLSYDPVGRLIQTAGAATTRFLYDGAEATAEYNSSGTTILRRFVHGPGTDEPIVWYEGTGTSDPRWLVENEQNSVIAVTNSSGAALNIDTYDEYGVPGASNVGRFQYTGQMWLPEASLFHYKARAYSAALGRFMQTDPILLAGGLNLYAYVGNDPVNGVDAYGLQDPCAVICVTQCRQPCATEPIGGFSPWNHYPPGNFEPRDDDCLALCEGDVVVESRRRDPLNLNLDWDAIREQIEIEDEDRNAPTCPTPAEMEQALNEIRQGGRIEQTGALGIAVGAVSQIHPVARVPGRFLMMAGAAEVGWGRTVQVHAYSFLIAHGVYDEPARAAAASGMTGGLPEYAQPAAASVAEAVLSQMQGHSLNHCVHRGGNG